MIKEASANDRYGRDITLYGLRRALAEVMWSRVEEGQKMSGIRFLLFLNEVDDSSIRRFIENQTTGRGE